jgi:hypothetical protein
MVCTNPVQTFLFFLKDFFPAFAKRDNSSLAAGYSNAVPATIIVFRITCGYHHTQPCSYCIFFFFFTLITKTLPFFISTVFLLRFNIQQHLFYIKRCPVIGPIEITGTTVVCSVFNKMRLLALAANLP